MNDFGQPTSITIPAKPEYVGIARLVIAAFAGLLGFDNEAVEDIKIAVSEVCTSAILQLHKEGRLENRSVEISAYVKNRDLVIDVGFATKEAASLEKTHTQLKERDLGMSVLTSIMDKVEIMKTRNNAVILRLSKRVPR
ncbi:MAG: ATP-binding protein [Actinobacteria bacterium]|nr:ATP-binding protein [Actinomycetota bacterium]